MFFPFHTILSMASSSCSLTDEQMKCGICLAVFTDPVTTSCGHNFCEVCIDACWDSGQIFVCPICKKEFETKPELKINTELAKVVADRMKMQENTNKSNVVCDFCLGNKLRAVKSCLQCMASYCETHLENHKTAPRRMRHKLISPVENLEDYICTSHEKPLEIFCRDDQTFLCLFCTETEHTSHDTVSIEQENSHRRIQLGEEHRDVKRMIQERQKKIKHIQNIAKRNKKNDERDKECSGELFTTLIRSIEKCQSELLDLLEEKQKAAENEAEDLMKELEQEITELKKRDTELEQISHTEDHLHLLQTYSSSACSPLQVKSWTNISINTDLNTETLKKTFTCLQENVQMEVKRFFETTQPSDIQEFNFLPVPTSSASALGENTIETNSAKGIFVFSSTNTDSLMKLSLPVPKSSPAMKKKNECVPFGTQQGTLTDFSETKSSDVLKEGKIYFTLGKMDKSTCSLKKEVKMNKVKLANLDVDLSTIQKLYAVDVILDPNTAYPKLTLSKDGKQVKYNGTWIDVPNNPERFDCSACVLGRDGFSCGRFYFEVQVGDKPEWDIGVASDSINKKGKITVSPDNGFWTVWLRNGNKYMANESSPISLCLNEKPETVGVFVDYEEGLVTFYNVETKSLIYSFTGQSFNEKLYAFLSPCNSRGGVNTKPLIISTDPQCTY
ncbi:putative E3 ubiquitin-protein ligase TRIM21-like [Triplophysa rosa]|uniref:E3 ubiquitin-protein ligase TRIM21-like n=1 Tax=Triplophysa rosa TaxID=992332 RepID=A0A9W7X5J5_TRIRA|nr:putative E3 ubiquitin-protein ligase TRIM21-like [Triplophysa rosa]